MPSSPDLDFRTKESKAIRNAARVFPDPVGAESLLFTELGFESLDAVVLCTAIQEHYQTPMPFAELLAEIGQQQRDLSINELTDIVNTHLGSPVGPDGGVRRVQ